MYKQKLSFFTLPCLFCVLFCTLNFSVIYAKDKPVLDTSYVYTIAEIEIVRTQRKQEILPAQTLQGDMLSKLSSHSVADAVRYFSGVQLKDYGGIGGLKTINIRSMGTNHMGVFYNGIQLGNAQNGQVDLGRFSLDNMESISLYNGQKSTVLQSAKDFGAAGSIYLQTKTPTFEPNKTYNLIGNYKTGSFGLHNPSLVWQQKITSTISSVVSAEYTNAHGRYPFTFRKVSADGTVAYDTTAIRKNADIEAIRTEFGLFGKTSNTDWHVQVYNYHSERGLPGYIARNIYEHQQRLWDNNFFVQSSIKYSKNKYSLLGNIKYADDYTRYLNPDYTLQYIDNEYRQKEIYGSLAQSFHLFNCWEMGIATDLQWNTLDADLYNFAYPTRFTELVAITQSFKFPHVQLQANALGTFVQEHVQVGTSSNNKSMVTPSLFASVQPWLYIPFNLHGFYKRIFRVPTFNDLYYTFVGNASLQPEYVSQYAIGAKYTSAPKNTSFTPSFDIQIDGYYNRVEDKIIAVPTANPFRWQMTNLGLVEIIGTDISVQTSMNFSKDVLGLLKMNYTYQLAQDKTDKTEEYYGHQIPYIPWHSGTAVVAVAYKKWSLNYSFIYTGERYNASANIPENYVQPWYTHDASISKDFALFGYQWTALVEINNLLNQQYDVVLNYPMPGTNFKCSLKIRI